jgi:hypothetical protein
MFRTLLPGRLAAAGLLCWAFLTLVSPLPAHAGNARLILTDEAAALTHPVLGLQRSALPLGAGFALDTSLLADLALAPNLGVRWALEAGPHRVVVGARYSHFVGTAIVTSLLQSQEPALKRFEPRFSGPSFYALYGLKLGPLLVQAEGRHARYERPYTTVMGALALTFGESWSLIGEAGFWFPSLETTTEQRRLQAAAGLRFNGQNFGFMVGAAYLGLEDALLPGGRVDLLPTLDLSWTFR